MIFSKPIAVTPSDSVNRIVIERELGTPGNSPSAFKDRQGYQYRDYDQLIIHESGHLLANRLKKSNPDAWNALDRYFQSVLSDPDSFDDLKSKVSRYATTSTAEAIAESFLEFEKDPYSTAQSKYAKEVHRVFTENKEKLSDDNWR